MKNLITLIIGLLVAAGCGKTETTTEPTTEAITGSRTMRIGKPLSPEEQKLVGNYEVKKGENIFKFYLLDNREYSKTDGYYDEKGTWKLVPKGNELAVDQYPNVHAGSEKTEVFKIQPNGDLAYIAIIKDNKREEAPKEDQFTYKRIK